MPTRSEICAIYASARCAHEDILPRPAPDAHRCRALRAMSHAATQRLYKARARTDASKRERRDATARVAAKTAKEGAVVTIHARRGVAPRRSANHARGAEAPDAV